MLVRGINVEQEQLFSKVFDLENRSGVGARVLLRILLLHVVDLGRRGEAKRLVATSRKKRFREGNHLTIMISRSSRQHCRADTRSSACGLM